MYYKEEEIIKVTEVWQIINENEWVYIDAITEMRSISDHLYEDLFEYIEKYNEQLKQLIEMGFDEEEIDIRLLKLCMGKIPYYLRNIEK